MPHYHYLIVGGGMTADAVIRGIREADSDGSIELVGAETERPYNRPPLSKGLWKGKAIDSIWRGTDATNAALHLGRTVVHLDPPNRTVVDDRPRSIPMTSSCSRRAALPAACRLVVTTYSYFRTLQGLPRAPQPHRAWPALCRHRRRVYRLGDRGDPGHERRLSCSSRARVSVRGYLSAWARAFCDRLLPPAGPRGARQPA